MPKTLAKVQKKIRKKGSNITSLHENSRDSQRLRRASARGDKLARVLAERLKIKQPYIQRVAYFKGAAKAAAVQIDVEQIQQLIQRYIEREDEGLESLMAERRPGRPASAREDLLKHRISVERREYDVGFWVPDLRDAANLKLLKEWNGEWTSLGTMKYVRLAKDGTLHDSSFPPKGQS